MIPTLPNLKKLLTKLNHRTLRELKALERINYYSCDKDYITIRKTILSNLKKREKKIWNLEDYMMLLYPKSFGLTLSTELE